jgi:hypothetical protein
VTTVVAELWDRFRDVCPDAAAAPDRLVEKGRELADSDPVRHLPSVDDPGALDTAGRMLGETAAAYWLLCLDWIGAQAPGDELREQDEQLTTEYWDLSARADALRQEIAAGRAPRLRVAAQPTRWPWWSRWRRRR